MALFDKVKGLLNEAKEKAGPMAEQAKEKAGPLAAQAKQKAQEVTEQVKEKAGPMATEARGKASEFADKVHDKASSFNSGDKTASAPDAADTTPAGVTDLGAAPSVKADDVADAVKHNPGV